MDSIARSSMPSADEDRAGVDGRDVRSHDATRIDAGKPILCGERVAARHSPGPDLKIDVLSRGYRRADIKLQLCRVRSSLGASWGRSRPRIEDRS